MIPAPNAQIFEGKLATFWFDESGILCAKAKSAARSLEMQKENYAFVRQIAENKKVCLLADTTLSKQQNKETRDYVEQELPNVFKAMAVVSASISGKFLAEFFLALKRPPIPIKRFRNEKEAKEWLKQYL